MRLYWVMHMCMNSCLILYYLDVFIADSDSLSNGVSLSARENGAIWFRAVRRGAAPDIEESVLEN